jgi:peroxin-5
MMNGFLHQNASLIDAHADHSLMGPVMLDGPSHGVHIRAQSTSPPAQSAADAFYNAPPGTQFGVEEFAKFRILSQPGSARSTPVPAPQVVTPYQRPVLGVGMMSMGSSYGMVNRPMYQPMYAQPQPVQQMQDAKGKDKVVELDDRQWEEQFAQIELQEKQESDDKANLAMEPELNEMDERILEGETGFGDLESIWNGIQAENAAMREAYDSGDLKPAAHEWDTFADWDGMQSRMGISPPVEEYLFEEENIFKGQNNPFEEGLRILGEGGNLSLAALAFEAACQKDHNHVDAWVQLGLAQAQNEKEEAAIRALEHALTLDANSLQALMGLAISYTNEGYDTTAYRTLERWLSVKYSSVMAPEELSSPADVGFTDRQQLHEKVRDRYIQAAQLSPDGEHMDPDVQVGLGVLFYGSEEYDKAVDCFQAALASTELGSSNQQSQLHLLWNRLGATLANSGRSEEAIAAYEKALTIRPNFVRARYNLGVSCINVGCHAEAAGHLLAALDMHKAVEKSGREKARELLGGADVSDADLERLTTQNRSTTLYDTLRRVFGQMGRRDLAEKVVVGMDPEIFRGEFDF